MGERGVLSLICQPPCHIKLAIENNELSPVDTKKCTIGHQATLTPEASGKGKPYFRSLAAASSFSLAPIRSRSESERALFLRA